MSAGHRWLVFDSRRNRSAAAGSAPNLSYSLAGQCNRIPNKFLMMRCVRFRTSDDWRAMLDSLPAPIYTTDAEGGVTYWNAACVEFAGREPCLGRDRWCVTWQLYTTIGEPMRHEDCPMAQAIKQQVPIRDAIAIAERPDGTPRRVPALPDPSVRRGRGLHGRGQHADRRHRRAERSACTSRPSAAAASRTRSTAAKAPMCSSRWRPGSNRPPTIWAASDGLDRHSSSRLTVTSSPASISARQRTSFFTGSR